MKTDYIMCLFSYIIYQMDIFNCFVTALDDTYYIQMSITIAIRSYFVNYTSLYRK